MLLTLLLAAGITLVPGPERAVAQPSIEPWMRHARSVAMATDGEESLLVWSQDPGGVLAVRLDREGRSLTPIPHLLAEPGALLHATWIDGLYVVFVARHRGLQVLRLTRELQIVDRRTLLPGDVVSEVHRVGDELVVYGRSGVHRLRGDLTPAGPPVTLPDGGSVVPAADGRFAVLTARSPAATMTLYDGHAFREPVRIDGTVGPLLWTGSEYVLIVNGMRLERFDRDLRRLGEPVTFATGWSSLTSVTAIGDDTVWIARRDSLFSTGQRIRRGVLLDATPIRLQPACCPVPLRTSDGRVLLADTLLRVAVVPPPGGGTGGPLEWTPAAFGVPSERLMATAASDTEIAVARGNWSGEPGTVTLMSPDAAAVRELPVWPGEVALASDGRDFFAFIDRYFQKLGDESWITIDARGKAAAALGWTGSELVTAWSDRSDRRDRVRVERITREGELMPSCATEVEGGDSHDRLSMAVGGGEVLVTWPGAMAWFRDGCPTSAAIADPLTAFDHRLAWQDGRWAMAFVVDDRRLRFAQTRNGPFAARSEPIARDADLLSFVAWNGGWAVLYRLDSRLVTALLDFDGRLVATSVVAFDLDDRASLIAVPGGKLLAVYARPVEGPPFFGVTRVFARFLEIEQGTLRRRGVRH